jgi:FkbM family methyltransferase
MNKSRWTLPRGLLHKIGLRLIDKEKYRLVRRSSFEEALERRLKQKDFFFVQVGSNDGVRFDGLYSKVTKANASGVVVEPLTRYFKRLQMNYEDYPGVKTLNAALHPTSKSVELFHVDMTKMTGLEPWASGIGSLQKDHHLKSSVPVEFMTSTTVDAVSFQELVDMYNVTRIDLLQIDVEGFDYEVLNMVPFDQVKPLLIKYEWVNLSEDDRDKALCLLSGHGYRTEVEAEDVVAILP